MGNSHAFNFHYIAKKKKDYKTVIAGGCGLIIPKRVLIINHFKFKSIRIKLCKLIKDYLS